MVLGATLDFNALVPPQRALFCVATFKETTGVAGNALTTTDWLVLDKLGHFPLSVTFTLYEPAAEVDVAFIVNVEDVAPAIALVDLYH